MQVTELINDYKTFTPVTGMTLDTDRVEIANSLESILNSIRNTRQEIQAIKG